MEFQHGVGAKYGFVVYCVVTLGFSLVEAASENTQCCIWLLVALVAFSEGCIVKVEYLRILEFALAVTLPFAPLEGKLVLGAFLALRAFEEVEASSSFSSSLASGSGVPAGGTEASVEFRLCLQTGQLWLDRTVDPQKRLRLLYHVGSLEELTSLVRPDRRQFLSSSGFFSATVPLTPAATYGSQRLTWVRVERRPGSRVREWRSGWSRQETLRVVDVSEVADQVASDLISPDSTTLNNLISAMFDASTILDEKLRITHCDEKLKDFCLLGGLALSPRGPESGCAVRQSLVGVPFEALLEDKLRFRAHVQACRRVPEVPIPIRLALAAGQGDVKLFLAASEQGQLSTESLRFHVWLQHMRPADGEFGAADADSVCSSARGLPGKRKSRKLLASVSEEAWPPRSDAAQEALLRDVVLAIAKGGRVAEDLTVAFAYGVCDWELLEELLHSQETAAGSAGEATTDCLRRLTLHEALQRQSTAELRRATAGTSDAGAAAGCCCQRLALLLTALEVLQAEAEAEEAAAAAAAAAVPLEWLRSLLSEVLTRKVPHALLFDFLCNQWGVFCLRRGLLKEAEAVLGSATSGSRASDARAGRARATPGTLRVQAAILANLALARMQLGDDVGATEAAETLETLLEKAEEAQVTVHPGCANLLLFFNEVD